MQKNWTQTKKPAFDLKGAVQMNEIAQTIFAPIYPVIAQQALDATGIRRGLCLDIGSGPAMLAIAIAQQVPDMLVVAVDFSDDSLKFATDNIKSAHLADRISTQKGDVHHLPFEDGQINLIVSRGSMFFWKDLLDAFQEMYRVLAPGGAAYIGGGFGSLELREKVVAAMLKRDPTWDCYAKKKTDDEKIARFKEMFQEIGCSSYRIINDETGFWLVFFKQS
jgi:ubiquinone/menaquinone biosynthesis C-methylase UbiE